MYTSCNGRTSKNSQVKYRDKLWVPFFTGHHLVFSFIVSVGRSVQLLFHLFSLYSFLLVRAIGWLYNFNSQINHSKPAAQDLQMTVLHRHNTFPDNYISYYSQYCLIRKKLKPFLPFDKLQFCGLLSSLSFFIMKPRRCIYRSFEPERHQPVHTSSTENFSNIWSYDMAI